MTTPKYQTPITAVPGYNLPAADWNAKLRDSLESVAKPPRVMVRRAADQLIGNAVVSDVIWTSIDYDTDNFWNPATLQPRLTCPADLGGLYLVTFNPIFDINAAGARYASIGKNGAGYGSPVNSGGFAGWYVQFNVVSLVALVPGDYVTGMVYHSAGAALNLKSSVYPMTMSMVRVSVA